jgi:DNA-binding NtrC family response regulator
MFCLIARGMREPRGRLVEGDTGLVGGSPCLRELLPKLRRVAPTEATVLIRGERGTGKELVARILHRWSRRTSRPYRAVNCAALPAELAVSELFGHERGAFTGAWQRQLGLFAITDGGTVFLDEVADLSLGAQSMLLRFLQGGEVRPLGSTETARVDVRVIAATNKNLEQVMEQGAFRADLYDRLNEVTIQVPPLRDRLDDIPALVEHFVCLHSQRHGVPTPRVSAEAMDALLRYAWPGNVRELEKAINRAVIFADDAWIRPNDLELAVPVGVDAGAFSATSPPAPADRERELLRLAAEHGSVRRRDVMTRFRISREAARRDLIVAVGEGSSAVPDRVAECTTR